MAIDPWLRPPTPNIIDELQPVAAMLLGAKEDVLESITQLSHADIWDTTLGVASIGFHVLHLAYSTGRLLSYANGDSLTEGQWDDLKEERSANETKPELAYITERFTRAMDAAVTYMQGVAAADLAQPREIGRKKLASTTRELLLHAGEHAARHAGQVVTTAKILVNRNA